VIPSVLRLLGCRAMNRLNRRRMLGVSSTTTVVMVGEDLVVGFRYSVLLGNWYYPVRGHRRRATCPRIDIPSCGERPTQGTPDTIVRVCLGIFCLVRFSQC
jgi:hypothetical protein